MPSADGSWKEVRDLTALLKSFGTANAVLVRRGKGAPELFVIFGRLPDVNDQDTVEAATGLDPVAGETWQREYRAFGAILPLDDRGIALALKIKERATPISEVFIYSSATLVAHLPTRSVFRVNEDEDPKIWQKRPFASFTALRWSLYQPRTPSDAVRLEMQTVLDLMRRGEKKKARELLERLLKPFDGVAKPEKGLTEEGVHWLGWAYNERGYMAKHAKDGLAAYLRGAELGNYTAMVNAMVALGGRGDHRRVLLLSKGKTLAKSGETVAAVARDFHGYLGVAYAHAGKSAQAAKAFAEYRKKLKRAPSPTNVKTIRALLEELRRGKEGGPVDALLAMLPRSPRR
jgi:hypothetical protein